MRRLFIDVCSRLREPRDISNSGMFTIPGLERRRETMVFHAPSERWSYREGLVTEAVVVNRRLLPSSYRRRREELGRIPQPLSFFSHPSISCGDYYCPNQTESGDKRGLGYR